MSNLPKHTASKGLSQDLKPHTLVLESVLSAVKCQNVVCLKSAWLWLFIKSCNFSIKVKKSNDIIFYRLRWRNINWKITFWNPRDKPYTLAVTTATWWQCTPNQGAMTKAKAQFIRVLNL